MERDARTRRSSAKRLLGALSLAALAACARRPAPPAPGPSPPPLAARPAPGYERRVDSLESVDLTALVGKRVAIDPGHGGFFKGSMGVGGLSEAAVNLGVSIELESLLVRHGAQVLLTRRDDRDFLTVGDSALRGDLSARVAIANAFHPDLFVSVHHNADAAGAHDKNETQTYFKLGDPGASLEAAASIHRFLKRNLGITGQRLLPGNYFVLRNSEAPAVLTEASYLTNPDVEARLALAEKRRLEAEALFLGIAHFLARRPPRVVAFEARSGGIADTSFREIDGPELLARVAGAYDRVALELDGERVEPLLVGERLEWRPSTPLAVGAHEARLTVSLAGVGSDRARLLRFHLSRRPAVLRGRLIGAGARLVGARVEVLDGAGLPSPDSVRVRLRAARPGVSPAETVIVARDGVAWGYLRISSAARAQAGTIATAGPARSSPALRSASLSLPGPARTRPWTGWAIEMPESRPLRGAIGAREPSPTLRWINRDGFVVLDLDSAGAAPQLPGYRAWGWDTLPPRRVRVAGGALIGRRIFLDPDGGGEDNGGMGPSGTRASVYNLEVARALAAHLSAAGAQVRLSRSGDDAVSEVERVRLSEVFGADRYLRIAHRPEPSHVGYYFASAPGRAWARRAAEQLARFGFPLLAVRESAVYPVQQTSCPALYVSARRVDDAEDESEMTATGAARAEATALYLALLGEWSNAEPSVDSLEVRDESGQPLGGARIVLGGSLVLEADSLGRARFGRTEEGPLSIEVEHPRARARDLLLDSRRGMVLTGRSGR